MEPQAFSTPKRKVPRDWLKCKYCRNARRKCEGDYDFSRNERCRNCITGDKPCGPRVAHSEQDSVPSSTPRSSSSSRIPSTPGSTTISLSSPIPDSCERQRGGTRTSFSGNEAKKPPPKEVVSRKLIDLGYLGDIYHSLSHRLKAVIAESANVEPIFQNEVMDLISGIGELVISRCNHLSQDVWETMPFVAPRAEKESACHTFDRKLRHLISLQLSHPSLDQSTGEEVCLAALDDFRKLKCFHCKVISLLATLYEEAGDHSQSLRMKEEANALETKYSLPTGYTENPTSEDFEYLSRGMSAALNNVDIPSRYAQVLPNVSTIFPSAHLAVHRQYFAVARDIIQAGADPHQCDILKRSLLHLAVETRNQFLLELALGQADTRHARDIFTQSALCIAAYVGDLDIFVRLLSAEGHGDTSVRNVCHRSILTIASGAGSDDIVRYLLENKCCPVNDPLSPQHDGPPSALFAAARGGHANIVETLLAHDASAVLQFRGTMPWEIAQLKGHTTIAERLQKAARDEGERLDALQLSNDEWMDSVLALSSDILAAPTPPITSELQHSSPGRSLDLSRSGSVMTASPLPAESLLPPPYLDESRKRSYTWSPHLTPSCPSKRSSRQSSGPSKRHQASNC